VTWLEIAIQVRYTRNPVASAEVLGDSPYLTDIASEEKFNAVETPLEQGASANKWK